MLLLPTIVNPWASQWTPRGSISQEGPPRPSLENRNPTLVQEGDSVHPCSDVALLEVLQRSPLRGNTPGL